MLEGCACCFFWFLVFGFVSFELPRYSIESFESFRVQVIMLQYWPMVAARLSTFYHAFRGTCSGSPDRTKCRPLRHQTGRLPTCYTFWPCPCPLCLHPRMPWQPTPCLRLRVKHCLPKQSSTTSFRVHQKKFVEFFSVRVPEKNPVFESRPLMG
jgi:hypothetical protein